VVLAGYTSGFYGNKGTTTAAAATAAAAAAGAPATANAGLYDMVAIGLSGSNGKLLWSWQVGSERPLQNLICRTVLMFANFLCRALLNLCAWMLCSCCSSSASSVVIEAVICNEAGTASVDHACGSAGT
jgi:hypothetical protein